MVYLALGAIALMVIVLYALDRFMCPKEEEREERRAL